MYMVLLVVKFLNGFTKCIAPNLLRQVQHLSDETFTLLFTSSLATLIFNMLQPS